MRYEVLTRMYGPGEAEWQNVWEVEGTPMTFATYEDAERELIDYIAECTRASRSGYMDDVPEWDEFQIVPVHEARNTKTIDEAREELIHFIESVNVHSVGGWTEAIDNLITAVRNEQHKEVR